MVKRSFLALGVTLLVAGGMAGCSAATPDTASDSTAPTTIRIAHNSNAGALTARIAEEQGFLDGLDVEFTMVENVETLPPALGKSFDIVLSTPTLLISAASQGIDIAQVGGTSIENAENPTAVVLAGPDSGVTQASDLAGKTIGILNETGTLHLATKFWLDQAGVPLDSINIVQVDLGSQQDQLMSGRIDAVETVMPFMAAMQTTPGVVDLGQPHLQMADEIGLILWATSPAWAAENADAVATFRAGLAKAVEWVEDPANETAARASLQNFTGLPETVIANFPIPTYEAGSRPQDLPIWLDAMERFAGFTGTVDLSKLVIAGE